ncbi:transglutaminase-like domain-containing protein [Luteipulveratus flavus]|uniref:Transglutaminase family protein n=1 Tax=Luteipulveratus flavus TaxID=3031728 RepID=A0ABT6CB51_9MICO|nr:transglutaminase family protein [Luteipulveratus sp. YIM 133296]MDF8265284.1 transglutaminase family protein [Luteipulveratus sp. YIM 133296]
MKRTVSSVLNLQVGSPSRVVLQLAVAPRPGLTVEDSLTVTAQGEARDVTALIGQHDGISHVVDLEPGQHEVRYEATVTGVAEPYDDGLADRLVYLLPSRYCESDRLMGTAREEFEGLTGMELVRAVRAWVKKRTAYVVGSSRVTDSAINTFLARDGVCRDFAHLTVAMLRAREVPARLVACYAPGLVPMDFHAVAEAYVDGQWHVVDSTGLAPRQSLLRISTGRDAVDTSFLTRFGGRSTLRGMRVTALLEGSLPTDDHASSVVMA